MEDLFGPNNSGIAVTTVIVIALSASTNQGLVRLCLAMVSSMPTVVLLPKIGLLQHLRR
jgi:hypothetical protein